MTSEATTEATETAVTAPAEVVKSIQKFVAEHGGSGSAVLQPIGRAGVRITLVGEDGILGDRVVDDVPTAKAVVEAVDGLSESEEWDRALTSIVTPQKGHWQKMAGWVARQTKGFPKPRSGN